MQDGVSAERDGQMKMHADMIGHVPALDRTSVYKKSQGFIWVGSGRVSSAGRPSRVEGAKEQWDPENEEDEF